MTKAILRILMVGLVSGSFLLGAAGPVRAANQCGDGDTYPTQERPDVDATFVGKDGCDLSNPDSCDCLFVFRNAETKEIVASVRGRETSPNADEGDLVVGVPARNYPLEWTVFAHISRDSARTENCYMEQEKSQNKFDVVEAAIGAGAGCLVGNAIPIPGVGCGVGAVVGFALSGELQDGFSKITKGNWDGGFCESSKHTCQWTSDEYATSPWQHLSGGYNRDQVSKISFRGHRGGIGSDDEYYCGLLVAKTDQANITATGLDQQYDFCSQLTGDPHDKCVQCLDVQGVWTAIGCINTEPRNMVSTLMGVGLSIAGGVFILMLMAASFTYANSSGQPKMTGQAKEMATSATIGLLFIIFSVTILRFIGVDLLRIPGFGT